MRPLMALLLCVATGSADASPRAEPQDGANAAEVVQAVRDGEQWIHGVRSFRVRLEGTWSRSEASVARRAAELRRLYPDPRLTIDAKTFPELSASRPETLEIMFDGQRGRIESHRMGHYLEVRVWDGRMGFVQFQGESPGEQDYQVLTDAPLDALGDLLGDLRWPCAKAHSFWWKPIDEARALRSAGGSPDGFRLVRRDTFRGTECFVLEADAGFLVWYVGLEDRRLRGFVRRALTRDSKPEEVIATLAARFGQRFEGPADYYAWKRSLDPRRQRDLDRAYWEALYPTSRVLVESWLEDYREVAPGCWFPMRQGCTVHMETDAGEVYALESRALRAVSIELDQLLPEEAFRVELREGVEVRDRRYVPAISYPYRRHMSEEERQTLLEAVVADEAAHRKQSWGRDAMVGSAAPPLPEERWINGAPMSWEDLRGQVVILDFWAVWCGPCRSDLGRMQVFHEQRDATGIVVIGVHAAGTTSQEEIRAFTGEWGLRYPICTDDAPERGQVSYGRLADALGIFGIPAAVVVDGDGKIAAHGRLEELWPLAKSLR